MDKSVMELEENFKKVFRIINPTGREEISFEEARLAFGQIGLRMAESEMSELIKEIDTDGNGMISEKEFVDIMVKKNVEANEEEESIEAFQLLDTDADGFITADDFHRMLKKMGENIDIQEVDRMFALYDIDCDGYINYEEFTRMSITKSSKGAN